MACAPLEDAQVAVDYWRCFLLHSDRLFAFAYVCLNECFGLSLLGMTLTQFPCLFPNTVNATLPFTMSPEYIAAQRAYMRYHNMNPIYGPSSKYVGSNIVGI